jgi:hypothetical protein
VLFKEPELTSHPSQAKRDTRKEQFQEDRTAKDTYPCEGENIAVSPSHGYRHKPEPAEFFLQITTAL